MFLDTANVNDIKKGLSLGIIDGVTTNPSILASTKTSEVSLEGELAGTYPNIVFYQVKGETQDEMYAYFLKLANSLTQTFGIKIPVTLRGLEVIKRIRDSHPHVSILGTVIYTEAQGILASMAGCDYIAPYYNRILNEGNDSNTVIRNIRDYIDAHNLKTQIMSASFKTPSQIVESLRAGAHTCTIPYTLLEALLENKSVVHDLKVFNACEY